MSDTAGHDKERRVTAGLRGASWDPAQVPEGMRTAVYPLSTQDGAPITGYLHRLTGEERVVVFIMHPRELLVTHYMVPFLLKAGYAVWVQGPRTIGNDLRLEHELAVLDVAAGMRALRDIGFDRVVMLGNSGGASLFAFYNQQASAAPEARIARTPGGRPTKLDAADLPVPDGFVLVAPHPGQGRLLQKMIDPSLTDEADPFSLDPSLFALSADNGFRDAAEGGARYAPEFVERYRAAQTARVARLDTIARDMIAARMAARKAAGSDDATAVDAMRGNFAGIMQVWRTDADLRCFDLTLDPSDRRWGTVWGAKPLTSNLGSVGFARNCTPDAWLSTWSGLSSNASFAKAGPAMTQPVIIIEYTGDNSVFPGDVDEIAGSIASVDIERHKIRGNHHGQSLRLDEPNGQEIAGAAVVAWLSARFPAKAVVAAAAEAAS